MREADADMARCTLNLAAVRQKVGVSLEQIAESTKISMRFLLAIEAEEYEKLPGGIFATSYLRQYAAAAGVDECELLADYAAFLNRIAEPDVPLPTSARGRLERWFRTPPAQSALRS